MRILHISTQKPNNTGSGTYMCAVAKGFEKLGYKQAIVAGIDKDDIKITPVEGIDYYPVLYNTDKLPFNVVGMSDVMPYSNTRYKDLDNNQVSMLKEAFKDKITKAINEVNPDLIICHHIYLLTSYVREMVQNIPVVGICHGTCLMQLKNHDLEREYIISNIRKLDKVLALHEEQRQDIIKTFNMDEERVDVLGSGYDENLFFDKKELQNDKINITYAGKIAKLKGVKSLIKSFDKLDYDKSLLNINIIGDGHSPKEYEEIVSLAKKSDYNINFLGKIKQENLANIFRNSHLFILPSFFEGLPLVVIEALASGCSVVTTDIPGVKDWIGDKINNSGKIDYIKLPRMKSVGIPYEEDLKDFEDRLYSSIDSMLKKIIHKNIRNKELEMQDKTWSGLCQRLENLVQESDTLIIEHS